MSTCQDRTTCRLYHNQRGEHLSDDLQRQIEAEQAEKNARRTAIHKALIAAKNREDCDIAPVLVSVDRVALTDGTFVVEVDVQYSSAGYQALYGYRERDGDFSLYQD